MKKNMKNSQEFTFVQKDIAHLYSMHLASIRTEYNIISLAHHTHSRRFLLLLHAGSKLHSGD